MKFVTKKSIKQWQNHVQPKGDLGSFDYYYYYYEIYHSYLHLLIELIETNWPVNRVQVEQFDW